jgi:IS30 family transposase
MAKRLRDLLVDNIRIDDKQNDDELRESLLTFGWVKELPAIADERGNILVGHRRLRLADELGIERRIKTVTFGEGDGADAERVKLAIASNTGSKPMTRKDRQRIAEYLYGKRLWTMEAIAEALGVSKATISGDLRNCSTIEQFKPAKSDTNPKGAGRPKGRTTGPQPQRRKNTPTTEQHIASMVLDGGKSYDEAKNAAGVSAQVVIKSVAREEGRREAQADPVIDPATLPKTAQAKLAAAERQQRKRLDIEFQQRVTDRVQQALGDILAALKAREAQARLVMRTRKGIMQREIYRLILSCLHPDSRANVSNEKLAEAFQAFRKLELLLVAEKEMPTPDLGIPHTYEDLMARRAKKNGSAAKP